MATFKNKFPSNREMIQVYLVSAIPVFIWSIISLLRELPALILRLSVGDLIGVMGYTLAFALFESGLVTLLLFLLAIGLPRTIYRDKFVAISTIIIFLTCAWLIPAQLNTDIIRQWGLRQFLLFGIIYIITITIPTFFIHRFDKLEGWINSAANRVGILSLLYIFFGVVGVIVVIIRNI